MNQITKNLLTTPATLGLDNCGQGRSLSDLKGALRCSWKIMPESQKLVLAWSNASKPQTCLS